MLKDGDWKVVDFYNFPVSRPHPQVGDILKDMLVDKKKIDLIISRRVWRAEEIELEVEIVE